MEVKAKISVSEFKKDEQNVVYYPVGLTFKDDYIPLKVNPEDKSFYNYLLRNHFKKNPKLNELEVKGNLEKNTVFIEIAGEGFFLGVDENYTRLLNYLIKEV